METVTSLSHQQFQQTLRNTLQQIGYPIQSAQIQCTIERAALLVLVDHPSLDPIDVQQEMGLLKQALSTPDLLQHPYLDDLAFASGTVRCYFRQQGQRTPKTGATFHLPVLAAEGPLPRHPGVDPLPPAVPSPELPRHSGVDPSPSAVSSLEKSRPHGVAIAMGQQIWRNWLKPGVQRLQAESDHIINRLRARRSDMGRWATTTGSLLVLGTAGIAAYGLSRPCVLTACSVLETARLTPGDHGPILKATDTFATVSQIYTQLLDVNYQLRKIPLWSPHYDETQTLLRTYEQKAEAVATILSAQTVAMDAAIASQGPPHPLETWQTIETRWQKAIDQLAPLASDGVVAPLATLKLSEYTANLHLIQQRVAQEEASRTIIQQVRDTMDAMGQEDMVNITLDGLQNQRDRIQAAIAQLDQVSTYTMAHAEAEHLRALYNPQIDAVSDRIQTEQQGAQLYAQAKTAAEQAAQSSENQQWESAVTRWEEALEVIQQVPETSTYHAQVQPLVLTYTTSLDNARQSLTRANDLTEATQQLAKSCQKVADICQAVESSTHSSTHPPAQSSTHQSSPSIQVWLAPESEQLVELAMAPPSDAAPDSAVVSTESEQQALYVKHFLGAIATVGKRQHIAIEVYGADGGWVGAYQPEESRYTVTPSSGPVPHFPAAAAASPSVAPLPPSNSTANTDETPSDS